MDPNNPYASYNTYAPAPDDSRRRIIIRAAVAVALITLIILTVSFFTRASYGTLELSAPKKTSGNSKVSVVVQSTDNEPQSLSLKPGETKQLKVRTGAVRVDGSAGDIKSVDVTTVKKGQTAKLTTPSGEQRGVKQLASDARYCPVVAGGQVYSFACESDGAIVRHTPKGTAGLSDNAYIFDGQVISGGQQYKDGVLGYISVSDDAQDLTYIDLATLTQNKLPLNKAVKDLMRKESPQIVLTGTPDDGRIALEFMRANTIYLFKDYADTNPVKITPDKAYQTSVIGRMTKGSFSDDRFIQYAGTVTQDAANEGTQNDSSAAPTDVSRLASALIEYDMQGKAVRTTQLDNNDSVRAIYKLTSDFYLGESQSSFTFYHYDTGERTLKRVYDIDTISSWTIWKHKVYMQTGSVLYEFAPGKNGLFGLHSLFSSPDYRVSEVYATDQGILFTGYAGDEANTPLNIYQLLDTLAVATGTDTPGSDNTPVDPATIPRIEPAYNGFSTFLDQGMASSQMDSLKVAMNGFIATLPRQVGSVTITGINYTKFPVGAGNDGVSEADFVANLDGNSYSGHVSYAMYEYLQLTMKDGGKILYDSGRLPDTSQN